MTGVIVAEATVHYHFIELKGGIMARQPNAAGGSSTTHESMEDEIRSLAYKLYCEGGYQNGRDVEYWLQAEKQVTVRRKAHLRKVL
jgi:Protein of unknown function (DUF2934)